MNVIFLRNFIDTVARLCYSRAVNFSTCKTWIRNYLHRSRKESGMVRVSAVGLGVVLIVALGISVGHTFFGGAGAFPDHGMPGAVCPPGGCPPMAMMPMGAPSPPPMPQKITKCKPQPMMPYCGPMVCPPPACPPPCAPVCKPSVAWY